MYKSRKWTSVNIRWKNSDKVKVMCHYEWKIKVKPEWPEWEHGPGNSSFKMWECVWKLIKCDMWVRNVFYKIVHKIHVILHYYGIHLASGSDHSVWCDTVLIVSSFCPDVCLHIFFSELLNAYVRFFPFCLFPCNHPSSATFRSPSLLMIGS